MPAFIEGRLLIKIELLPLFTEIVFENTSWPVLFCSFKVAVAVLVALNETVKSLLKGLGYTTTDVFNPNSKLNNRRESVFAVHVNLFQTIIYIFTGVW